MNTSCLPVAELTPASISICIVLILTGLGGLFLMAMLADDNSYPGRADEDRHDYLFEALLFLCGALVVGSILYLLPLDEQITEKLSRHGVRKPSLFGTLIVVFSLGFYLLARMFMKRMRRRWAEEDRLRRVKRPNPPGSKKHRNRRKKK